MTDQFPEKFSKYKIIEEVGRGGFADVYKAVDTTLNRAVALKFLEPQLLREPTFVERFQREVQLAANLKHPHIVIIYEFGWEAGAAYLAMEFLEGRTLKELIFKEGALPPNRIVNMVRQIASGVSKCWGSERRLSSTAYRNQASGSLGAPLGLDSRFAPTRPALDLAPFPVLPQLLYAPTETGWIIPGGLDGWLEGGWTRERRVERGR